MKDNNSPLKMTLTLVIICVLVAFILSAVNKITKPVILKNQEIALQNSLKTVIDAKKFEIIDQTEEYTVFKADDKGIVIMLKAYGYGGEIDLAVGVDNNKKITGLDVLSHSETAGLGANLTKPDVKKQVIGKVYEIKLNKNSAKENEVKAISGATVTSKAVTDAVNYALQLAEDY